MYKLTCICYSENTETEEGLNDWIHTEVYSLAVENDAIAVEDSPFYRQGILLYSSFGVFFLTAIQ